MSTPAEVGLARWYDVVARKDAAGLPAIIAPDAVFRSPAVHAPQEGRDVVVAYLSAAFTVLGPSLTYHDEWVRESDAVLRFTTVVEGLDVEGIDLIRWNADGLIQDFTVMVRPFKALEGVIAAMARELFK